ncbi:hypothetical protein [Streptomyces lichenis]|uniref:Alpha/beta hydrolase n=1 Tax=Streptomyces lichenis TaxID=2306967 RepID=A0ABT0IJ38_9ACTN|nr:hypothetical protein [Streptomyces lichenis]MCK8681339.1 hypothetical protein [Streptomyces lichenis]
MAPPGGTGGWCGGPARGGLAGRCSVPLLIANSRADRLFRSDERRFLAAARAAGAPASLVHIGGSHLAALSHPETFTRVLRAGHERLTGMGADR